LRCSAFSQYNPAEFSAALGALEEYRGVDEVSVVGCVGSLIVATRGAVGPGEVLLSVRGSKEAYLACSDQPLPRGTEVLVIDTRGARTVLVEPWIATDLTTQLP
jgi:membrane protein implicated in regulation of membrane protease activity